MAYGLEFEQSLIRLLTAQNVPMESERLTRKKRIDPLLRRLGWTVEYFDPERPLRFYPNCAIEEYPTDNGPADYALCIGGRIVGVVEAKKLATGPQEVLTQAQR